MSTYTQQYTRPYTDGYKDRPDESTPEYARYINARDDALLRIEAFLAALNVPSKLSELVNDEGFIKNTVSNLANYYLKSETYARTETYTQAEVQALIADAVSITNELAAKSPTKLKPVLIASRLCILGLIDFYSTFFKVCLFR